MTHSVEEKVHKDESGNFRGNKHGGRRAFNIELVRDMMIIMKHPTKFNVVPFARGQGILVKEPNTALFNIARTADREPLYKWVGPLQIDDVYFYEPKHQTTGIRSIEDAKTVKQICVLRATSQYALLTNKGFKNVIENNTWAACLQMLSLGRVNLVPASDSLLGGMMKEANVTWDQIQRTPVIAQINRGYIAFSKEQSDDVIRKWQNALDQLKPSGKYDQLVKDYMLASKQ